MSDELIGRKIRVLYSKYYLSVDFMLCSYYIGRNWILKEKNTMTLVSEHNLCREFLLSAAILPQFCILAVWKAIRHVIMDSRLEALFLIIS
jgi:hypothetical protein